MLLRRTAIAAGLVATSLAFAAPVAAAPGSDVSCSPCTWEDITANSPWEKVWPGRDAEGPWEKIFSKGPWEKVFSKGPWEKVFRPAR
jgi:hypothetical protein